MKPGVERGRRDEHIEILAVTHYKARRRTYTLCLPSTIISSLQGILGRRDKYIE